MTTEEFKKQRPEYAHLEGNDLWDAMTFCKLREQQADTVLLQIKPFWKRYRLRYLFYVRKPNGVFITEEASPKRCIVCKRGSSTRIYWAGKQLCLCGEELREEPNTNWSHRRYVLKSRAKKWFFYVLEQIHLVRYTTEGRYDMFGDESNYVQRTILDKDWKITGRVMRPRKWYEYIFIEKP